MAPAWRLRLRLQASLVDSLERDAPLDRHRLFGEEHRADRLPLPREDLEDRIALLGPLGAGKTQFAKGFASGLGVIAVVNSPSFTLMAEYDGRLPLFHQDLYQLRRCVGRDPDSFARVHAVAMSDGIDDRFFGCFRSGDKDGIEVFARQRTQGNRFACP